MFGKKHYIFTNRRHTYKGMLSTVLGLTALVSFGAAIYFTFLNGGESLVKYGAVGLLCTLFALAGLTLGILSRLEKDRYHLFSWLGIGLNLVMLVILGGIIYLGVI